ncbi:MAG: PEP-CTERM sorting domain-containing protein [Phycisphaeraceae bacterium]
MLTHKMNRVLGLVAMGGLLLVGQSAMAGSINDTHFNFTGNAGNNWGWTTQTDPNTQLGGTNQLIYTYGATNAGSYLTNTFTDAAAVFPDGQGTRVVQFQLDLTHFHTGTKDYVGPAIAQISSAVGNTSLMLAGTGKIADLRVAGLNAVGQFVFTTSTAVQYTGSRGGGTSNVRILYTSGTPAFPLVWDVTWTVSITGSEATSWTVTSGATLHGPTDTLGTIGDIVISDAVLNKADATFHGWKSATNYMIGSNGQATNNTVPGDYIAFSSSVIPEPATLGLLALGGLLMIGRGKR